MTKAFLSHKRDVLKLAELVSNNRTQNKPMYAVDLCRWGISEPFSDCENMTMYRETILELAEASFISDDDEY